MRANASHQRLSAFICGLILLLIPDTIRAADPAPGAEILQNLKSFREFGSVLYVAAHPDDENTQLMTYLSRGRHLRVAYLSLTRGDGGQNVLGPEFGEQLGVIRTQELLAARRIDGGQQFFTRALDFGFSKDYRETLRIWDKQQVLADIVRVIRTFRPEVVITRFSPEPGNTHGHHTASAVLALEAFKLAGDPKAFPDQLNTLTVWQPKRILQNGRGGNGLQMDISGDDPVSGESFAKMAARSRSMHKTQGFGNFAGFGGGGNRPESFTILDGEPATKDILDGVDTTWSRIDGGADIGKLTDDAISHFDPSTHAASVQALLEIRTKLTNLPKDSIVAQKSQQLDRIIAACAGLTVETTVPSAQIVPGEALKLHHTATVHSDVPVKWLEVRYPSITKKTGEAIAMKRDQSVTVDSTQTLPPNTPLSQPYWLREDGTAGMFRVDDASLIGRPENPPAFPVEYVFDVGGQTLVIPDEPRASGQRLDVIAPVSLSFAWQVQLFSPGKSHAVIVEVDASRADTSGTLGLHAPDGWKIEPATQDFHLSNVGDRAKLNFNITAPPQPAGADITADAVVNGAHFDTSRIAIRYEHVPPILLQPRAKLKAVAMELITRGHTIGYLPGAGDSVAEALQQMGYDVTILNGGDLVPENLKKFDALVIGVRAFNVRGDLADKIPAIFSYVQAGGTVIEQYNRPDGLKTRQFAPFDLALSGDRVTDETAAVTFLAPDHPLLNTPNKITASDFDGWVQERGIYFPNHWADQWTPLLSMSDPNEQPLNGSLLVADYGKGKIIYTGLVFFRELPAGVPGAYRLVANLVSAGNK
jgi:LmbE family N-acetylglucosaminyl deacetylase